MVRGHGELRKCDGMDWLTAGERAGRKWKMERQDN